MRTLEDAIISETQRFVDNIARLNTLVASTNDDQVKPLLDKLRSVERKMSLVSTSFQTSWYGRKHDQDFADKHSTNRPAF
ncbi:hypothetical protein LRAMOSA08106 [Lichtheimia ramosa]|uniref:Uncharacterized protein n=1 Tax=Lichtheimia ramosa TaxID=688394 RepID=A0A077WEM7_9FUNG|nr:hypothetical protein LRAMOSA08106 [Lichtheimia ramosa]